MTNTPSCSNCTFSIEAGQDVVHCRRYPAQVMATKMTGVPAQTGIVAIGGHERASNAVVLSVTETGAMFPPMKPNGWCGEWKKRLDS